MKPYLRKIQYYETDQMGVAHHANYLHWMEEARIDFMDQIGCPYARMEAQGVISPVKSLSCDYIRPCSFGDEIAVTVSVGAFNGVVLKIDYTFQNQQGETMFTASSEHVFLNREGRFVRLRRELPEFFDAIQALLPAPGA